MDMNDSAVIMNYHTKFASFAVERAQPAAQDKEANTDIAMYHPTILVFAMVSSLASLLAGLLAQGKPETGGGILNVSNSYLFLVCVSGAILGGVVSALLLPSIDSRKKFATKFLVSSITASLFSPWIINKLGFSQTPDSVLAVSGAVALLAWGVVRQAIRFGENKINAVLDKGPNQDKPLP